MAFLKSRSAVFLCCAEWTDCVIIAKEERRNPDEGCTGSIPAPGFV